MRCTWAQEPHSHDRVRGPTCRRASEIERKRGHIKPTAARDGVRGHGASKCPCKTVRAAAWEKVAIPKMSTRWQQKEHFLVVSTRMLFQRCTRDGSVQQCDKGYHSERPGSSHTGCESRCGYHVSGSRN